MTEMEPWQGSKCDRDGAVTRMGLCQGQCHTVLSELALHEQCNSTALEKGHPPPGAAAQGTVSPLGKLSLIQSQGDQGRSGWS